MQIVHADRLEAKAQYYAATAFNRQVKKGDEYYGLEAVIFVAFCDFSIFPEKKHYKCAHVIFQYLSVNHLSKTYKNVFLKIIKPISRTKFFKIFSSQKRKNRLYWAI